MFFFLKIQYVCQLLHFVLADYSKDLLSYLKYSKDVVFAGLTTSFEEDNFIEQLWNLYETQEVSLTISSNVDVLLKWQLSSCCHLSH